VKKKQQLDNDVRDLVEEISKNKPNLSRVKNLTRKFDIQFSSDPIEQMSLVLQRFDHLGSGLFLKSGIDKEKDVEL